MLRAVASVWATPTSTDAKASGNGSAKIAAGESWGGTLTDQTCRMPGPLPEMTSPAGLDGAPAADLNPRFVEALMGVPPGWLTPCTSVGTDSYLEWLRSQRSNLRGVLAWL